MRSAALFIRLTAEADIGNNKYCTVSTLSLSQDINYCISYTALILHTLVLLLHDTSVVTYARRISFKFVCNKCADKDLKFQTEDAHFNLIYNCTLPVITIACC
jgi:hypothetical protein